MLDRRIAQCPSCMTRMLVHPTTIDPGREFSCPRCGHKDTFALFADEPSSFRELSVEEVERLTPDERRAYLQSALKAMRKARQQRAQAG